MNETRSDESSDESLNNEASEVEYQPNKDDQQNVANCTNTNITTILEHSNTTNERKRRIVFANKLLSKKGEYIFDDVSVDRAIKDFSRVKRRTNVITDGGGDIKKTKKGVSGEIEGTTVRRGRKKKKGNFSQYVEMDSFDLNDGLINREQLISITVPPVAKALDDEEERFIVGANKIKIRLQELESLKMRTFAELSNNGINVTVATNDGSSTLKGFGDLHEAVRQGLSESSVSSLMQLLDWNTPQVKKIGSLCKVFWDGEDEWFYARILNYDKNKDKHYVSPLMNVINPQYNDIRCCARSTI